MFIVGDKVRLVHPQSAFQKGYKNSFGKDIYTVHRIRYTKPVTYELIAKDGTLLKGGFYQQELQKIQ